MISMTKRATIISWGSRTTTPSLATSRMTGSLVAPTTIHSTAARGGTTWRATLARICSTAKAARTYCWVATIATNSMMVTDLNDIYGNKRDDNLNGGNGNDFCRGGPGNNDTIAECEGASAASNLSERWSLLTRTQPAAATTERMANTSSSSAFRNSSCRLSPTIRFVNDG